MKRALAARLLQSPGMAASNSKSQTVTPESQSRLQKLLSIEPAEGNTTEFAHSQQEYNFRLCFLLWMLSTLMLPFFIIWYSWRSEARYSPTCHVTRPTVPRASACRLNADNADTTLPCSMLYGAFGAFCMTKFGISSQDAAFWRKVRSEIDIWLDSCLTHVDFVWQKSQKVKKETRDHEVHFVSFCHLACFFGFSSFRFSYPQLTSLWDDCKGAEPMTGWTMHRMGVPFQTKRMYHLHPPVSCGFFGCEILYLL